MPAPGATLEPTGTAPPCPGATNRAPRRPGLGDDAVPIPRNGARSAAPRQAIGHESRVVTYRRRGQRWTSFARHARHDGHPAAKPRDG